MAATDNKTLDLIKEVTRRKAEISKIEKPNWKTNCSFPYVEGKPDAINIHVERDVRRLLLIATFLMEKRDYYFKAAESLDVKIDTGFTWAGFPVEDWAADIKARISMVQITEKKKSLEELEKRLNKIVSPEKRAEMELEAIEAELK